MLELFIPVQYLTDAPWYVGIGSFFSFVIWLSMILQGLIRYLIIKKQNILTNKRKENFLLSFILFFSFIYCDDFFSFHERIFPIIFQIKERFIIAFYGIVFLYLINVFQDFLLRYSKYLIIAILFFGLSLSFDFKLFSLNWSQETQLVLEEVFKIAGLVYLYLFMEVAFKDLCNNRNSNQKANNLDNQNELDFVSP